MFFYYDPTYILVIIGAVICMAASAHVNSTYRRYAQVRSRSGMTGKDAAERILHANGIYDVTVHHIPGNLTDHYNPANKTLGLSDATYNSASWPPSVWLRMNAGMQSSMRKGMRLFRSEVLWYLLRISVLWQPGR